MSFCCRAFSIDWATIGTCVEKGFHVFEGGRIRLRVIVFRKLFQMHGGGSTEVAPCLLSRKDENRRDQTHQRFENLVHSCLSRPSPVATAEHHNTSGLCDIDVETAEIHGTELVYSVVDLMELVLLVGLAALLD